MRWHQILLWAGLMVTGQLTQAQDQDQGPDTLNRKRLTFVATAGALTYGGAVWSLYDLWYKNYDLGHFHTFNDINEWRGMDKAGHFYATYAESELAAGVARWAGLSQKQAAWLGAGSGMLIQTTLEVLDGFSEKWGFSWYDMAFNAAGAALFLGQELHWGSQRIRIKGAAGPPRFPETTLYSLDGRQETNLRNRGEELFGKGPIQNFLKNYNASTVWLSINPSAFMQEGSPSAKLFPAWLNIAVGIGAENLYGGHDNTWSGADGAVFVLSEKEFPRYTQFFLSLDIDLSRIPTRNRWLKTIFKSINWIKIPAPTLEWNTRGQWKGYVFHP